MKKVIETSRAPAAAGAYSQAIRAGDFLYISGQLPYDVDTQSMETGPIDLQTRQVMSNIGEILSAVGLVYEDIVKVDVFLTNIDDFPAFNEVYGQYFDAFLPARSTVEVARLPKGVKIEIAAVAYDTKE